MEHNQRLRVIPRKGGDHRHPPGVRNPQNHRMMNKPQQQNEGEAGLRDLRKRQLLKERVHQLKEGAVDDHARTHLLRKTPPPLKRNKMTIMRMKALKSSKICVLFSDSTLTFSVICLSR